MIDDILSDFAGADAYLALDHVERVSRPSGEKAIKILVRLFQFIVPPVNSLTELGFYRKVHLIIPNVQKSFYIFAVE